MTAEDKILTNLKDDTGEFFSEKFRRVTAVVAMVGGWAGGAFLFIYATFKYNPNQGHFAPQWVGFTFFFCLFVAIAGTLVRSRMRLSTTITETLRAGALVSETSTAVAVRENRETLEEILRAIKENGQ